MEKLKAIVEFDVHVGRCENNCDDCMGYYIDEGCQTCVKDAKTNPYEFGYKQIELES